MTVLETVQKISCLKRHYSDKKLEIENNGMGAIGEDFHYDGRQKEMPYY